MSELTYRRWWQTEPRTDIKWYDDMNKDFWQYKKEGDTHNPCHNYKPIWNYFGLDYKTNDFKFKSKEDSSNESNEAEQSKVND